MSFFQPLRFRPLKEVGFMEILTGRPRKFNLLFFYQVRVQEVQKFDIQYSLIDFRYFMRFKINVSNYCSNLWSYPTTYFISNDSRARAKTPKVKASFFKFKIKFKINNSIFKVTNNFFLIVSLRILSK